MILRLLARALLGKFVDFRSTKWRTDLFNGVIVLENIALQEEALKRLDLPLHLAKTSVQRLKVVIPYRTMDIANTSIELEGISCVMSSDLSDLSSGALQCEHESEVNRPAPKPRIQRVNEAPHEAGRIKKLLSAALRNLRVTLKDTRFEYRCQDATTGRFYTFGATLSSIVYGPTNSAGAPTIIPLDAAEVVRRAMLTGLSVYVGSDEMRLPLLKDMAFRAKVRRAEVCLSAMLQSHQVNWAKYVPPQTSLLQAVEMPAAMGRAALRRFRGVLGCGVSDDDGLCFLLHPTHFDAIHTLLADLEAISVCMYKKSLDKQRRRTSMARNGGSEDTSSPVPAPMHATLDPDEGYLTPEEDSNEAYQMPPSSPAESECGGVSTEEPWDTALVLDAQVQVPFIEVKVITESESAETAHFLLMVKGIGVGVKRRVLSDYQPSLDEKILARIHTLSLDKILSPLLKPSVLRLIESGGTTQTPWLRFERHMSQGGGSRYVHTKAHAAQLAVLLDHQFASTVCCWNRRRRHPIAALPKNTGKLLLGCDPQVKREGTVHISGLTVISPIDPLVHSAPAVGMTLAVFSEPGIPPSPTPTTVLRFGVVWTDLEPVLQRGVSSLWSQPHGFSSSIFASSQKAECLEVRIEKVTGMTPVTSICVSPIDIDLTVDRMVQVAWMVGTWRDTLQVSTLTRVKPSLCHVVRLMHEYKRRKLEMVTVRMDYVKVWIDLNASGPGLEWLPAKHVRKRGASDIMSPWIRTESTVPGLCALEISKLHIRKSSHQLASTMVATFDHFHLDACRHKASDCQKTSLVSLASNNEIQNIVEIRSDVTASHTSSGRASLCNHFIEGFPVELGAMSTYLKIHLGVFKVLLDTSSLAKAVRLLFCVVSSMRLASSKQHPKNKIRPTSPEHFCTLASAIATPSRVIEARVAETSVECFAAGCPVLDVVVEKISSKVIEFTDRQLNIITGGVHCLVVTDKTTEVAVVDGADEIGLSNGHFIAWDIRNRHLKIKAGQMRMTYLNRVTKEVLAFVKHYVKPALATWAARPEHLLCGSWAHWLAIERNLAWFPLSENIQAPRSQTYANVRQKPMAVTVVLNDSEIELPKDSSGEDALVLAFPRFTLTSGNAKQRGFEEPGNELRVRVKDLSSALRIKSDQIGVIRASIHLWARKRAACIIQQVHRIRTGTALEASSTAACIAVAYNRETTHLALLIAQRRQLVEELGMIIRECDPAEWALNLQLPFQLQFSFENARISNLTEEGEMCPCLDLYCTLKGGRNVPNHGVSIYSSVFEQLRFASRRDAMNSLSPMSLDILTPQIDLRATTDQWALIFELISGNFREQPMATDNPTRVSSIAAAHMVIPRRRRFIGVDLFTFMPAQIETAVRFVEARIAIVDDAEDETKAILRNKSADRICAAAATPTERATAFEGVVEHSCAEVRASGLFLGIDTMKGSSGMRLALSATQIAVFDVRRPINELSVQGDQPRRHPVLVPVNRTLCDQSAELICEGSARKQAVYELQNSPYYKCHNIHVRDTSLVLIPDTLKRVVGFFAHPFTGNEPPEIESFGIRALERALKVQSKDMKVVLNHVVFYGLEDLHILRGLKVIPDETRVLMADINLNLLHGARGAILPSLRPRQVGPGNVGAKLALDVQSVFASTAKRREISHRRRQPGKLMQPLRICLNTATAIKPLVDPPGANTGTSPSVDDASESILRVLRTKWMEVRTSGNDRKELDIQCSLSELQLINNIIGSAKKTVHHTEAAGESARTSRAEPVDFPSDENISALYLSLCPINAAINRRHSNNSIVKARIEYLSEGGDIPILVDGSYESNRTYGGMQGALKLGLAASYFNQNLCILEPLVEPFDIFAQWSRKSRGETFTASILTGSIDVNVTSALLQQLSADVLSADKVVDVSHEPYLLRNETGETLNLAFEIDSSLFRLGSLPTNEERDLDLDSPAGWGELDDSMAAPVRPRRQNNADAMRGNSQHVSRDHQKKNMQVSWRGILCHEPANIDDIGEHYLHFGALEGASDFIFFIVRVEINHRGQRCITIGTQIYIINSMHIEMDVLLRPIVENSRLDSCMRTLRPTEAFYVPVQYIKTETTLLGRTQSMRPSLPVSTSACAAPFEFPKVVPKCSFGVYEVVFGEGNLGLKLALVDDPRKKGARVPCVQKHNKSMSLPCVGDILEAIGGVPLPTVRLADRLEAEVLGEIVEVLKRSERPVTLLFRRDSLWVDLKSNLNDMLLVDGKRKRSSSESHLVVCNDLVKLHATAEARSWSMAIETATNTVRDPRSPSVSPSPSTLSYTKPLTSRSVLQMMRGENLLRRPSRCAIALKLLPAMRLHNLLCVPMEYIIRDGGIDRDLAHGILPIGGSVMISAIRPESQNSLMVRITNYSWCKPRVLFSNKCYPAKNEVMLQMELRRFTSVAAKAQEDQRVPSLILCVSLCGVDVTVFCRTWIINETGLDLQYCPNRSNAAYNQIPARSASSLIHTADRMSKLLGAAVNSVAQAGIGSEERNRNTISSNSQQWDADHICELAVQLPGDKFIEVHIAAAARTRLIEIIPSIIAEGARFGHFEEYAHVLTDRRRLSELAEQEYVICYRENWRTGPALLNFSESISDLQDMNVSLVNREMLLLREQDRYCSAPKEDETEPWFWNRSLAFDPPRSYAGDTELCVRVRSSKIERSALSEWSPGISAQKQIGHKALSGQGRCLELKTPKGISSPLKLAYRLGVDVSTGQGPFSRTTILKFVPHHILVNASTHDLEYTQVGCEEWNQVALQGRRTALYYWPRGDLTRLMMVRFKEDGKGAPWSSEFSIDCPGDFWVKLRRPRMPSAVPEEKAISTDIDPAAELRAMHNGLDEVIMRLHVESKGAALLAHFERHDEAWPPYRIENNTGYEVRFRQVPHKGRLRIQSWDVLGPHSSASYAWDHPEIGARVLRVEFEDGGSDSQRNFSLEGMKPGENHGSLQLRRVLPKFNDAAFYGELDIPYGSTNSWARCHCALKDDDLFVFKPSAESPSRELLAIINLSCSKKASRADAFQNNKQRAFLTGIRERLFSGDTGSGNGSPGVGVGSRRRGQATVVTALGDGNAIAEDSVVAHLLQAMLYPSEGQKRSPVWAEMMMQGGSTMKKSGCDWVGLFIACGLSSEPSDAQILGQALLERRVLVPVAKSRKALTRLSKLSRKSVTSGNRRRSNYERPSFAGIASSQDAWSSFSALAPDSMYRTRTASAVAPEPVHFYNSSEKQYILEVQRDADINPSGKSELVVVSASGKRNMFRCGTIENTLKFANVLRRTMYSSSEAELSSDFSKSGLHSHNDSARGDDCEDIATVVDVRVHSDGATKVLEFSEEMRSEKYCENLPPAVNLSVELAAVTLSFVDSLPEEVLFSHVGGIKFRAELSPNERKLLLTVDRFQVDNQVLTAQYSTLVRPSFYSKARGVETLRLPPDLEYELQDSPALHVLVHQSNLMRSDCISFESIAVWLRPLELMVDVLAISKVIEVFQGSRTTQVVGSEGAGSGAEQYFDCGATQAFPLSIGQDGAVSHIRETEQYKLYCKQFQLFAVELTLTSSFPSIKDAKKVPLVLSAIPEINEAKILLSATNLENIFGPPKQLVETLKRHYIQSFIFTMRSVIGSIDVIGNPIGLLRNVSSGVKDFVYQPLQPLSQHHDSATHLLKGMAHGAALGTTSLVSKSMSGTFETASKLTGAVGSGIALTYSTTMDDRLYAESRNLSRTKKGTSATNELYRGGRALGVGIYDGVSGVLMEPIRGVRNAQEENSGLALGLSKGIARGLVGVAVKPAVGLMDFTARATEAMRKASTVTQRSRSIAMSDPWARARPPRVMSHWRRRLEKFDVTHARAQLWLAQAIHDDLLKDRMKDVRSPFVEHLILSHKVQNEAAASSTNAGARSRLTRWVLCTHCRLLLLQEPQGSVDTERKPAILIECPIGDIEDAELRQNPQQIILSLKPGTFCKFSTERATLKRPKIFDQRCHLESIFYDVLVRTVGWNAAKQQAAEPARCFVALEGKIKKLPGGNLLNQGLRSATRHWCIVAKHVLYIYHNQSTIDASTVNRTDDRAAIQTSAPLLPKQPTGQSLREGALKDQIRLWIVIPLCNLSVEVYKKTYIKLAAPNGHPFPSLKKMKWGGLNSSGAFTEVMRNDFIFQPDDDAGLELWNRHLRAAMVQPKISPDLQLLARSEQDADACRHIVIPCEQLDAYDAQSLLDGISGVMVEVHDIAEDLAEFKREGRKSISSST